MPIRPGGEQICHLGQTPQDAFMIVPEVSKFLSQCSDRLFSLSLLLCFFFVLAACVFI
ncbi:MAG: hypothetical protein AB7Q64_24250 [Verrucomicrobiales bacterium]